MGDISLDSQVPDSKISLGTDGSIQVGPDEANERADKAYWGSHPWVGGTRTDAYNSIAAGNETSWRQTVAKQMDADNQAKKTQALLSAANPAQLDAINRWNAAPTDPNEVIEKNYSNWYNQSQSPLFQFREYANTQAQNADATLSQQDWGSWLWQRGTEALPGVYDVKMRWNTASSVPEAFDGLLGSYLSNVARNIYSDPTTARTKFDAAMASLAGNPSMQSTFAHAVLGQTNDQKLINNVFSLMDLGTVPGILKFGNGLARSVSQYNTVRRTLREAYESANREASTWTDPNVARFGTAGDVSQSAITKTSNDLYQTLQGKPNPARETLEDLPSVWQTHVDALAAGGGGRYGNGIVNQIKADWFRYGRNVTNLIQNVMRVNTVPFLEAVKGANQMIRDAARNRYRGPGNTLMDVEGPVHDNASNSYLFTYVMGDRNMEPFDSAREAFNAASEYGYPAESTVRDRVNRDVGPKLAELEFKIRQLVDEKQTPPPMDADTAGLNRWNNLDNDINALNKQREDLLAYQAEYLVGPEMNIPGAQIRQIGTAEKPKYVIAYKLPLQQSQDIVRDGLIFQSDWLKKLGTTLPDMDNHIKSTLAWIRTPGETLSPSEVSQRVIATHGPGSFLNIAMANSHVVAQVPRRYRKDFMRVLEANQDMMNPHDGLPGYFFETVPDLADYYLSHIGRYPSQEEIRGYFAHKMNWDYDHTLRSLLMLRNKNIAGVESHSIRMRAPNGQLINSPYFDGVTKDIAPGGNDLVAIIGDDGKSHVMYTDAQTYRNWLRKTGEKDIKEGRQQVVELYQNEARPLQRFLKDNRAIRYVISNKFDRKSIQLSDQLGRRDGGHWDHDYTWAVKQANMVPERTGQRFRQRYEGDTFVVWAENQKMAQQYADHMNNVRHFMEAGEIDNAKAYHQAHFNMPWEEHRRAYFPKEVDGEMRPAQFSMKEPFQVVRKDTKIVDLNNDLRNRYGRAFYDATREGSIARTQQIQYTGERDARDVFAVSRQGDWRNPVFGVSKAKMVDPMVSMDRALSRIINSTFMEDYKIMGMEHWLQNASRYIDLGKDQSLLKTAPWYVFNKFNPQSDFTKQTPEAVRNMLTNNWKKINDFVGIPSKADRFLAQQVENLSSWLYGKTGVIVPHSWLPRLKNPVQFLRSSVFNMKFLFSPGIFFTQASTFVNVAGIQGLRYAPIATSALMAHLMSRTNSNPEILRGIGKLLENFGWNPGEWEEAKLAGETWGNFLKVGQEHAYLGNQVANHTITNFGNNMAYWGRKFFEEGAELTRQAAFYSAYKQWKNENAGKEINRIAKEWIMSRAADLDHNMSRAFNSNLHTGWASLFGQFHAYSMRIAELMSGKRLTGAEKMRLAFTTSVMWGVPLGGLGVTGLPIGEIVRQKATEQGYTPGQNVALDVVMKGVPSVLHSWATGEWYDYEKFGVDPIFQDFVEQDTTMWDLFGGATWQTYSNAIARSYPIWAAMNDTLVGGANLKLTWRDLISPFQEFSAINDAERLRIALSTGQWVSKNQTYLTDVDQPSAWFMTMTGMTKSSIPEMSRMIQAQRNETGWDNRFINQYVKEMRAANQATLNNDQTAFETHFRNAAVWMDKLPIEKRSQALAAARNSMTPLVDRIKWQFWHRGAREGTQ